MQNTEPNKGQTKAELNQQNPPQTIDQPATATFAEKTDTSTVIQAENSTEKVIAAPAPQPVQVPAGVYPYPQNVQYNVPQPQYRVYVPVPREPYVFTKIDAIFGIAIFILGYFAVRFSLNMFGWGGFKVALHTFAYATVVLAVAFAKKIKPLKESWYWLFILLVNALSYAAWPGGSMVVWRFLLMMCLSLYWPATVFGGLLQDRTSNILLLDIANIVFVVPFENFAAFGKAFSTLWKKKRGSGQSDEKNAEENAEKSKKAKSIIGVLIGVGISIPLLLMIVPLLQTADSTGGFRQFFKQIGDFFNKSFAWFFGERLMLTIFELLLAIPLVFYICGFIFGFAQKRYIKKIDIKSTQKNLLSVRILSTSTVVTVLSIVSLLYAIFLVSQAPYFFSAFTGKLAGGYINYAEYARDGFFELCRLAALNLLILLCANIFSKTPRKENTILRIFNIALSATTMLLILTAFSKMALYISVHGLTIKRVQVSAFLVFLLLVWAAVIVLQFFKFSIVRFSMVVGIAILCLLCVSNVDRIITNYNLERIKTGTIQAADIGGGDIYTVADVLMYDSLEPGDVDALIWMYDNGADVEQRKAIARQLKYIFEATSEKEGTASDTFSEIQMRAEYKQRILVILREHNLYGFFPENRSANSAWAPYTMPTATPASTSQKQSKKYSGARCSART